MTHAALTHGANYKKSQEFSQVFRKVQVTKITKRNAQLCLLNSAKTFLSKVYPRGMIKKSLCLVHLSKFCFESFDTLNKICVNKEQQLVFNFFVFLNSKIRVKAEDLIVQFLFLQYFLKPLLNRPTLRNIK